jgi:thiol-disulfide isomerase/thioredoxin
MRVSILAVTCAAALVFPATWVPASGTQFNRVEAAKRIEARFSARQAYWLQGQGGSPGDYLDAAKAPKFDDLRSDALGVIAAGETDEAALQAIRALAEINRTKPSDETIARDGHYRGETADMALATRLARILVRHHLQNPMVLFDVRRLQLNADVEADIWREIFARHGEADARATAAALLIEYCILRVGKPDESGEKRRAAREEAMKYAQILRQDYSQARLDSALIHPPRNLQILVETPQGTRVETPAPTVMVDYWTRQLDRSPGARLPDVAFATITGGSERLSQYRGKVLVLDFWTTWCGPCRAHQPDLIKLKEELAGQPFEIIGVSGDKSPKIVADYMRKTLALPWVQWHIGTDSPVFKDWGLHGYPTYFVLDAEGTIHERTRVLNATSKELIRKLVVHAGGKAVELASTMSAAQP